MIVVMNPGALRENIDHVVVLVEEMGLKAQVIEGTDLTVVAAIGDDRLKEKDQLEQAAGVNRVVPILSPYKMAAKEIKPGRTEIALGENCVFGGEQVPIIAGPCSVEGEDKIIEAAKYVKAAGAHALRGGAFKPRTNPYAFQGYGEDGLKMLVAAREVTGLPIVTEVLANEDVDLVSKYADCLQIGTRNCQNFRLLDAVGRQDKPVLFKRGMSMTIDEYLQAADYILAAGNEKVILCERGIRTFENHTRNTLSLSVVPELQKRTHLPIIIDPSHGTGKRDLVPSMSLAAVAAGCDGLAIEMHQDPEHAWTDGAQSVTPAALRDIIERARKVALAVDRVVL